MGHCMRRLICGQDISMLLQFGVARNVIVEVDSFKPTHVSPRMGIYYWASILSIDLQCT